MLGRTLGHYRIVESLGRGGMGEVYRAEDSRLGRSVALKVLPAKLAEDRERRRRFEREARAIAALDHPNIVTVFSIEEDEGTHFITMQLVEGRPLGEAIPRNGMPLDKFFDAAIQLADAVSSAHEKGIMHRDLKPANIMISDTGKVSILDFGLAKLRGAPSGLEAAPMPTERLTGDQQILGTAAYMSPEQAEGRPVDHRADIFSLGIVLHEMATGRHPFEGGSKISVLSAILRDEPGSVTDLRPGLPRHLARIIKHALEKDVRRRYQSVLDLRNDLEDLRTEIDSGVTLAGAPVLRRTRWRWAIVGAAAGALAIAAAVWLYRPPEAAAPETRSIRTVPLTSWQGSERDPALSPRGDQIAFVWDGETRGRFDLYVMLPGGGQPLELAQGDPETMQPAWSPDGLEVAFLRQTGRRCCQVVVVPALGGKERALAEISVFAYPGLDWSPDGSRLAVVEKPATEVAEAIALLSTETGARERLSEPPSTAVGDRFPVFSPDGSRLAFVRWYEAPYNEIFLVDLATGAQERLAEHDGWIRGIDWLPDSSGLLFSSLQTDGTGIWRVSTAGELEQLSRGDNASGLTVAADGDRVVYAQSLAETNLWRTAGPAAASPGRHEKLIGSTRSDWAPHYSPDGSRIAFTSDRSGAAQIWLAESDGTGLERLATDETAILPRWSPDGSRLAFALGADDNLDVWVIEVASGFKRALSTSPTADSPWSWSPDGRWVYFLSDRTGRYEVWRIDAEGAGPDEQITRDGGLLSRVSEDGRWIYYLKEGPRLSIWKAPSEGGDETPVVTTPGLSVSGFELWRSSLLYFLNDPEGAVRIERLDLATGATSTLTELGPGVRLGKYGRMSVSPDGAWIVYPRDDSRGSDLILVEGLL